MRYFTYNENDIKFEPRSIWSVHLSYIFIIIILLVYIFYIRSVNNKYEEEIIDISENYSDIYDRSEELLGKIELLNESAEFNEINLRLIMEGMNIKFIDIAIAQSKLETANYNSDIFIESGNLFGMKPAKLRPYTHFGEHRGHADYKGMWKLSIIDYALWQAREAKNVKTEDQYYFLLGNMYAEDPEYINKLKNLE